MITLPAWTLLLLPLGLGVYLMSSDRWSGGFLPLPGGRTFVGCGVVLLTIGAAIGLLFASCAK